MNKRMLTQNPHYETFQFLYSFRNFIGRGFILEVSSDDHLTVTMASRTTALLIRRACVLSRNLHLAPSSQSCGCKTKVISLRNGLPQTLISSFHTTGPAGNFDYENDSDETLESLCEKFEAILDSRSDHQFFF